MHQSPRSKRGWIPKRLKFEIYNPVIQSFYIIIELERLKASRLTEELPSYLDQLRAETDSLKGRVEEITRNQAASSITTEELVGIGKMTEKATKEMKARRSQCLDILDMISEGSGKNRATLMEEMGLEKDPA